MAVAASVHWSNGFFSTADGYEFPAVLGAGAAALALTGPGALSLDRMTAGALDQTWLAWLVVPAAIISSSAIMTRRRRSCAESGPGREPVAAPHGAS
jgi:putative oxidoreductase